MTEYRPPSTSIGESTVAEGRCGQNAGPRKQSETVQTCLYISLYFHGQLIGDEPHRPEPTRLRF